MKKRRVTAVIAVIAVAAILLTAGYLVATGFVKRTDVALVDYSVSEDGTQILLRISVISSMGYTRGFQNSGGGVNPHYLTFYATFGGLNSPWGAKNAFALDVSGGETEVYFCRGNGSYELVLEKDIQTGVWKRP